MSEIITYMTSNIVKNQEALENKFVKEETYFNIPIYKKNYPSCYQYNVLIMLAKRLLNDETSAVIN